MSSGDVYRAYEIFRDGLAVSDNTPATEEAPLRRNLFPYRGIEPENFLFEHYDKILVEKILLSQSKIKSVILRLGAVYGAHDSQRKLKDYIQPMLIGKDKLAIDPVKAQWRWTSVFVREVVNAIQLAVEKTGGSEHEVFNVGEQTALTQLELLMKLKELTEWKGRIEIRPNRGDKLNYQQHLLLNTDKIRSKIGYVEQHNLEQGLTETIEFETDTIRT
ncbi:MAG: NAD(P)-dependent oxidoreductase [Bacteroidota bacterium]